MHSMKRYLGSANSCLLPLISFQVWWGHLDLTSLLQSQGDWQRDKLRTRDKTKNEYCKKKSPKPPKNLKKKKSRDLQKNREQKKNKKGKNVWPFRTWGCFHPNREVPAMAGGRTKEGDAVCRGVRAGTAQLLWGWCKKKYEKLGGNLSSIRSQPQHLKVFQPQRIFLLPAHFG